MSEPSPRPVCTPADLHRRLAARDPLAPAEFAAAFLDVLVAHLRAGYPRAHDHVRIEAAEDALLSVIRNPAVYDPARGDLAAFLRMAAAGDLRNLLARERRHQEKREDRDCVELEADAGNSLSEGDDLPSFDDPRLAPVVAALSEADRRVLDLMRDGEHRTAAFAAVLGIAGLSPDEQRCEVKRVKDRIMVRLKRAGGGA